MLPCNSNAQSGFTLLEVTVAILTTVIMLVMSSRGIDTMARTRAMVVDQQMELSTLSTGLQQWVYDLDNVVETPPFSIINWDGRVLRLIRRSPTGTADGMQVSAWARSLRGPNGTYYWLRWHSKPSNTRAQLLIDFEEAGMWAQQPATILSPQETTLVPLDNLQIYFYLGGAWTNPLSSSLRLGESPATGFTTDSTQPDAINGIRLVLTLPPNHPMGGSITRDWLRPTLSENKS